jgi:hypothetical protein
MIIFKEVTSRHRELVQVLVPLVQTYKKSGASSKAVLDFVTRMANVLENQTMYSPNEIRGIDRGAFLDIIREWMAIASAQDISVIKSVFQI